MSTLEVYLVNDHKFIGDNFHEIVLAHAADILKMFKEVKAIPKLEKIEDSIKLGQLFC